MRMNHARPPKTSAWAPTPRAESQAAQPSAPNGNGEMTIQPLLSMADLCRILQVSRSKLERLRAAKKVPPPDVDLRTVSKPIPRWRPDTIRRWIESGGRL